MSLGKSIAATILSTVQREITKYIDVYTAEITEIATTGLKIQRIGETVGSNEIYARLSDLIYMVGDEVLVIEIRNRPFVVGVVRRASTGTPTGTVLTNAGTGASCTISGTDYQGQISFVAGSSGVSAGNVFDFEFADEQENANYAVVLTNGSNAAGDLQMRMNYTGRSTTKWTMNFRVAPTASATYLWSYIIRPYVR